MLPETHNVKIVIAAARVIALLTVLNFGPWECAVDGEVRTVYIDLFIHASLDEKIELKQSVESAFQPLLK